MRYFVIAPGGQKYGPADVALLNQWALEGRLTAESEVENEITGERMLAGNVPGFAAPGSPMGPGAASPEGPQPSPYQQPTAPYSPPGQTWQQPPTAHSNYPRSQYSSTSSAGSGELTGAWVLGAVNFLVCCPVLPIIGLILANKAAAMGHPGAQAARVFNIVLIILSGLLYLGYILFFVALGVSGF
jgi:hypothetical protein